MAPGALQLLARDRDDVARLTDVRRFAQSWEAAATLQLRDGNPAVVDTYAQHGRLHDGESDMMLDAAYTAWRQDQVDGKQSLLIAPTREQVALLNRRAQADRITTGHVHPDGMVALRDGTAAGDGDIIVTRRNDRRLHGPGGWVRNGDRWRIRGTHSDGTLTVQPAGLEQAGTFQLPADYVAANVELGYATTAHCAQGATVDTTHAIVSPAMTRETLYVAMTRGRQGNHAYTITDTPDTEPHQDHHPTSGRQVLTGVLGRTGAEPSAHDVIAAEQDRQGSIAQLAAEYETIAAAAQRPRCTQLIHTSGLSRDQADQAITSGAFGQLCAALRQADASGLIPEELLPKLVRTRPLDGVDDIAAVLHNRLDTTLDRQAKQGVNRRAPRLIAGLIPPADGPMAEDMRAALDDRQQLIEQLAPELARTALTNGDAWTRHLGPPPTDPHWRRTWLRDLDIIDAYRDRHSKTSDTPLGLPAEGTQPPDARAALSAVRRLHQAALTDQHGATVAGQRRPRPPERHGPSM